MKTLSILLPLFSAVYVMAHGHLRQITVDSKTFEGPRLQRQSPASVIRQVDNPNPNRGANEGHITCGPKAKVAALQADARPGSTLTFNWRGNDGSKWPHNTGPCITYLANCGAQTCDKVTNPASLQWFKIQEEGKVNGQWCQKRLYEGGVASAKLPANLAPGNYLVRHELISLHLAEGLKGAEFYPACAQIKVSGNGNGRPKASDLVRFPGAYKDSDAGIRVNAFTNAAYKMPGPKVAQLGDGAAPAAPAPAPAPPVKNNTPLPAAPAPAPPKSCGVKKRSRSNVRRMDTEPEVVVRAPEPEPEVEETEDVVYDDEAEEVEDEDEEESSEDDQVYERAPEPEASAPEVNVTAREAVPHLPRAHFSRIMGRAASIH